MIYSRNSIVKLFKRVESSKSYINRKICFSVANPLDTVDTDLAVFGDPVPHHREDPHGGRAAAEGYFPPGVLTKARVSLALSGQIFNIHIHWI